MTQLDMFLPPLSFGFAAEYMAETGRDPWGVEFEVPESWRRPLGLGDTGRFEYLRDGSFGVRIPVKAEVPPRPLELAWGTRRAQRRRLLFGRDPLNGRPWVAMVFQARPRHGLNITIRVLGQ